ncbi:MAG: hypothetical protein ACP5NP_07885 [Acetobacteraceae bacterium]
MTGSLLLPTGADAVYFPMVRERLGLDGRGWRASLRYGWLQGDLSAACEADPGRVE